MLLIVSPRKFVPPLKKLRRHKNKTGMPTELVTLEAIYRIGYPGDEAEQIKRYIADRYHRALCRFVLLVGDADVLPVRYTKTDRKCADAQDTAFYPTDLYYAALHDSRGRFDTWDRNNNGYYGELRGETGTGTINVDGVSLRPDVAVGRIPASTLGDVKRYVWKCVGYERNACNADWAHRAMLVATHDWKSRDWASGIQMNAANTYLSLYPTTVVLTRNRGGGDRIAANAITAAVNRGIGLLGYVGHGHPTGLAIPTGWWRVNDVKGLTNNDRWPIVAAAACSTGEFATLPPYGPYVDVNGVQHAGTNDGEVFAAPPRQPACVQSWIDPDDDLATQLTVKTPHGAVAYFGGVTGMQYHEPVDFLLQEITLSTTVGDAWRAMVNRYYLLPGIRTSVTSPDWSAVARFHQPWKYMLFGDPSLRVHGVGTQAAGLVAMTAA